MRGTKMMLGALAAVLVQAAPSPAPAQGGPAYGPGGLMPQMFRTLDTNNDGTVSQDEYRGYQSGRFGMFSGPGRNSFGRDDFRGHPMMQRYSAPQRDSEFRGYDANRDGTVTQEEWMKWAEARFKARDTNGDGKISEQDSAPNFGGGPGSGVGPGMMGQGAGPGAGPGPGMMGGPRGR